MHALAIIVFSLACARLGLGAPAVTNDLSEFFGGREGCFVLYDSKNVSYIRYNPKGCAERFSPCSTFKIPNTLIALHTGVASGPEFALPWDGVKRGGPAWDSDPTLRSAFQNSTVWFYQELARRVGHERETQLVRKLAYGNMDTSGGATNFWLESSLRISADEQVAFLLRLWADALPVSGKTGTGGDQDAGVARLGWFMGCVRRRERKVFFATRITGKRDASGRQARKITEEILEKLGI